MIYLIFAILFSASLALALRISETFSDNRYGILVGNYVTCLVVAFVLLPDKNIFAAGSRTAVPFFFTADTSAEMASFLNLSFAFMAAIIASCNSFNFIVVSSLEQNLQMFSVFYYTLTDEN